MSIAKVVKAAVIVVSFGGFFASCPPVHAEDGWRVLQDSLYYGEVSTAITARALRMDTKDASILVVAPFKGITLFNNENHLYFYETLENFQKRTGTSINDPHDKVVVGKKQMIAGLSTQEYDIFSKAKNGSMQLTRQFWLTKDSRISPKLADTCAIFVSVKTGLGMPIKILTRKGSINKRGPLGTPIMENALNTISFEPAKFSSDFFKLPANFSPATSEAAVLFGERSTTGGASDLDGLFKK